MAELYNDLYGTTRDGGILRGAGRGNNFFGAQQQPPRLPKNLGLPQKEYIKLTNLNEKYDAYDFSMIKSTQSKAKATAVFRSRSFERALGLSLKAGDEDIPITSSIRSKLMKAEKKFLKEGKEFLTELQECESELAQITMDAELQKVLKEEDKKNSELGNVIDVEVVSEKTANFTTTTIELAVVPAKKKRELVKKMSQLQTELKELELKFIQEVIASVGSKRGVGLRNAFLGNIAIRGAGGLLTQLQDRPLLSMITADGKSDGEDSNSPQKKLFVMNFPGDVRASQLNELREEVTAVIRNSQPGDEALVVLQSGGGTVTGYGLAAGQLVRLKEKGLYLTIAVEEVAASGGYMMSCVADKIVASPFAILGSIGVISEIPNFYERLKEEGM